MLGARLPVGPSSKLAQKRVGSNGTKRSVMLYATSHKFAAVAQSSAAAAAAAALLLVRR
jgi:hypothetical protein